MFSHRILEFFLLFLQVHTPFYRCFELHFASEPIATSHIFPTRVWAACCFSREVLDMRSPTMHWLPPNSMMAESNYKADWMRRRVEMERIYI